MVQLDVATRALELVDLATEPGRIVALPHLWGSDWKDEARELKDHRTERVPTPQYQMSTDRDAAISKHGETKATEEPTP